MTVRSPISPDLIDQAVVQALERVFETMIKAPIRLIERTAAIDLSVLGAGPQIMGCVGFVGEINGFIHLRLSEEFAAVATGLVLDMTPNEVRMEGREVIKDTIGELTNMSVGGFKNRFCDIGYPCKLTLPTIVWGDKLSSPTIKGAMRHVYHFEGAGHPLLADLQIKAD